MSIKYMANHTSDIRQHPMNNTFVMNFSCVTTIVVSSWHRITWWDIITHCDNSEQVIWENIAFSHLCKKQNKKPTCAEWYTLRGEGGLV